MKIYNRILFFIIVLSGIFNTSCNDNKNDNPVKQEVLPELTTQGLNTMGCLFNGSVWLPAGKWFTPGIEAYFYPYLPIIDTQYHGNLDLRFYRKPEHGVEVGDYINIYHLQIPDTGRYINWGTLSEKDSIPGRAGISTSNGRYYSYNSPNNWLHIIHLDTANRIMSGRFEFDLINERDTSDIIHIRDGRFDVTFIY